ncbi:hypothetical protein ATCC90586_000043 [Pythium insidiosum]|nr:hypothetical protein ATCC90586_000043 [Pythium insidiosum]
MGRGSSSSSSAALSSMGLSLSLSPPRQLSLASLERLAQHELFDFGVPHPAVADRLVELQTLLRRGAVESDLPELLDELVHELEDEIHAAGASELYLLAALQHFRQQMQMLLDLDQDALLAQRGAALGSLFAAKPKPTPTPKSAAAPSALNAINAARREHRQNAVDDDAACGVCLQKDSLEHDPIVLCELCGVAVHQSCYRLDDIPDDDWYCHPCARYLRARDVENNVTPTYELPCAACAQKGGAFIATVDGKWVHMACSMFLPELFVQSSQDGEVIGGLDQLKARRQLRCCFCKTKDKGACAQCVVGKCTTSYHVLCALQHGLKFVFMEDKDQFGSGCTRHQRQFLGKADAASTDDDAMAPPSTPQKPRKHKRLVKGASTPSKGKRRPSKPADSSDGSSAASSDEDDDEDDDEEEEDGVLLDQESDDDCVMVGAADDSDGVVFRIASTPPRPTKRAKPRSPATASGPSSSSSTRQSPGKTKPKARTQQQLSITSFGQPKQLSHPPRPPAATTSSPASKPLKPLQPLASSSSAASLLSPPPPPPRAPSASSPASLPAPPAAPAGAVATMEIVKMPAQVLLPVVSAASKDPTTFEDVLIVIPTAPLGISVRLETRAPQGSAMLVQARDTSNPMMNDAFRHGLLRDGDEMFAINDISLRNRPVAWLRDLLGVLPPPFRCWIRTSARRSLPATLLPTPLPTPTKPPTSKPPTPVAAPAPSPKASQRPPLAPSSSSAAAPTTAKQSSEGTSRGPDASATKPPSRSPMDEALSTDWPWFYLRSDGKLAMSLTWKSLDAGFFVAKWNPATWNRLFGNVETLLGFRLRRDHPAFHETNALIEMPRRETALAPYLLEHRASVKNKRRGVGPNASVFVGVNVEAATRSEEEWDAMPRLDVGTTVDVAKRTWPGINKLGGAGRIKKVHEVASTDGKRTRFLYDVAYILGGSEKKIERKWITVVDIDDEAKKNAVESTAADGPADSASATDEEDDGESKPLRLRLGFRLGRRADHKDTELPAPEKDTAGALHRRVHLQVTVHSKSVHLERKPIAPSSASSPEQSSQSDPPSAKVLLWHQHFPAKQSPQDAALSDALSGELLYCEPRDSGDDAADAIDSDDEENEIKTQLRDAQQAFARVMARNEELLAALQLTVSREYGTKAYRAREMTEIQARHYEQLYRDMAAARKRFDESDDDEDDDVEDGEHDDGEHQRQSTPSVSAEAPSSKTTRRRRRKRSDSGSSSSNDEDESCGGLFVNRIKQEGDEVCALCELTGGDFAATSCGRVVHPQCAMYTPETFFKDGVAHGLDQIPAAERGALSCAICGGKRGLSKIQCANQRCLVAYHVACAFVNGLLTRDPYYQAWCPKHLKTSGMASEVEWPRHLRPQGGSRPETVDGHDDEVDSADGEDEDSQEETESPVVKPRGSQRRDSTASNRKRKRRDAEPSTKKERVAPMKTKENVNRRLDIEDVTADDDEEDAAASGAVFAVGDTVLVQPREWRGSNKPGGVARVVQVHELTAPSSDGVVGEPTRVVSYDVAYVLTNGKEKNVEARQLLAGDLAYDIGCMQYCLDVTPFAMPNSGIDYHL